jgi:3-oxoacyl-[acyl-carrier protein] reductase
MTEGLALVTGAARGIGLAIARRLAQDGHRVVLLDVLADATEASAAGLRSEGLDALGLPLDASDEAAVLALPQSLGGDFQRVRVLVNNAGISPKHDGKKAPVAETSLEEWNRVLAVNLTGTFLMSRLCIGPMKANRWGRIVNMASQAARTRAEIAGSHYAASKTGMVGFSRVLAGEVAADGITVNCIAPGRIETPMSAGVGASVNEAFVSRIPTGRAGTPEEVAQLVSFLASDQAAYITGATIDINGGGFMA